MDRIVERGRLYDFYGELLTGHQRRIYEDAVYNDLSLSEIAQEQGVSKQAVHDLLQRCTDNLAQYEDKLHMIRRYVTIQEKVLKIRAVAAGIADDDLKRQLDVIAGEIEEALNGI